MPRDSEAYQHWLEVGVPAERIFELGAKDNFWAMGDTGPCGPCSEIYYDLGVEASEHGKDMPFGEDDQRYVEIWNLVFMQFDRSMGSEGPVLTPLPKPSIDTGMGLERVACVLQSVVSNYQTDLFTPLIARAAELTGFTAMTAAEAAISDAKGAASLRIISDHARAATFLISDGVLPANEGRGYVLRKILRRGIRHGRLLGQEKPFMHEMVFAVRDEMSVAYPELKDTAERVAKVVLAEEEQFARVIANGALQFDRLIDEQIRLKQEERFVSGQWPTRTLQDLKDYQETGRLDTSGHGLSMVLRPFASTKLLACHWTLWLMPRGMRVLRLIWLASRRQRRRSRRVRELPGRVDRRSRRRRFIGSWLRRSLRDTRRCGWMGRGCWRW